MHNSTDEGPRTLGVPVSRGSQVALNALSDIRIKSFDLFRIKLQNRVSTNVTFRIIFERFRWRGYDDHLRGGGYQDTRGMLELGNLASLKMREC